LIEEHMAWAKREGKIKSRLWPMHKRAHLRWWLKTLHGVNLRALPRARLSTRAESAGLRPGRAHHQAARCARPKTREPLIPKGTRGKLISTIKSFYNMAADREARPQGLRGPLLRPTQEHQDEEGAGFGKVTKLNSIENTLTVMAYWEKLPLKRNGNDIGIVAVTPGRPASWGCTWRRRGNFEEIVRSQTPAEEKSRISSLGPDLARGLARVDPRRRRGHGGAASARRLARFKIT